MEGRQVVNGSDDADIRPGGYSTRIRGVTQRAPAQPPGQEELVEDPATVEFERARPARNDRRHATPVARDGKRTWIREDPPIREMAGLETAEQAAHVCADSSPGVFVLERRRIDDDVRRRSSTY
jgi:hypothetical protein